MKDEKQRTGQQNKSEHLWFEQLADALNDAGYDQKLVYAEIEKLEVPNTKQSVKAIFRAVAHQMYGVNSTAELTTAQTVAVGDAVARGFAVKFGIDIPWPSEESQMNATLGDKAA